MTDQEFIQQLAAEELARTYIYTLWYTNECGYECEHEFEAQGNEAAKEHCMTYCRGNEGLWSGIYLLDEMSQEVEFNPF